VLIGFLTGVGIQVALGQLSGMLGIAVRGHGTLDQLWGDLTRLTDVNPSALAVSVAVLLVIGGSRLISEWAPGPLIAVILAIVASWAFGLGRLVTVLGTVPRGIPSLGLPSVDWSWELFGRLVPTAFSMFLVILTQSAATSRAYATRYNERFSENVDLVGLAAANIGAGLSGTFVVNGSPTKTQMVDSAGGRSQLSQIVTASVVLLVVLFFTAPLGYMPEAALSAVVFLIGIKLIDLKGMCRVFRRRRSEFWVALITAIMVVAVGVQQGILLAIVLSLIDHTRRGYRPKNVVLVPGESGVFRARSISSRAQALPGLVIYRFTHSIYYANAQQLSEEVLDLVNHSDPELKWLCLDASAVDDIDFSAAETLRSLRAVLDRKGIRLAVTQVPSDDELGRPYHLRAPFGNALFFDTPEEVLTAYREEMNSAARRT
jgi:MFS superfamily sulfate permease-like transporter